MTRKEKCLYVIKRGGSCWGDGESCDECSIQDECQPPNRTEPLKLIVIKIFLKEFGTKSDLVELLL